MSRLRAIKMLIRDLPRDVKLAYCLLRDPRVPMTHRAACVAALTAIATPWINLPEWIPVIGELDVLALTALTLRTFIATAPAEVVEYQRRLIDERRSVFDLDVDAGRGIAARLARRFFGPPSSSPMADNATGSRRTINDDEIGSGSESYIIGRADDAHTVTAGKLERGSQQ